MSQSTKTIRVSMEIYNKLCELGKKNDTFSEIIERIFRDNPNMTWIVMEK
jgi:predicted CopG family antitoxin